MTGNEDPERDARARRGLVPFEVAAVLAIAAAPWPDAVPVAVPLLVAATLSRSLRGRGFGELLAGGAWVAGVAALSGLAALALAVAVGAPFVEQMSGRLVEWSAFPAARGSAAMLAQVSLVVVAMAIAHELALRGWIVERVLELSPGPPILPVLVGAFVEALLTPGDLAGRLGAAVFGAGLGWLYVAAGRSVLAPLCARVAFSLGAALLDGLRLVG